MMDEQIMFTVVVCHYSIIIIKRTQFLLYFLYLGELYIHALHIYMYIIVYFYFYSVTQMQYSHYS